MEKCPGRQRTRRPRNVRNAKRVFRVSSYIYTCRVSMCSYEIHLLGRGLAEDDGGEHVGEGRRADIDLHALVGGRFIGLVVWMDRWAADLVWFTLDGHPSHTTYTLSTHIPTPKKRNAPARPWPRSPPASAWSSAGTRRGTIGWPGPVRRGPPSAIGLVVCVLRNCGGD